MLHDEKVLTFSEAARHLPRVNGRRPHASTIWRWARRGISGVKLETRRIGARFVTSVQALERFTAALAEVEPDRWRSNVHRTGPPNRANSQRQCDIAEAEAELAADGFD